MHGKVSFLEPDKFERQGILKTILKSIDLIGNLNVKLVLDVGCGRKPYFQFFKESYYIGVDLPQGNSFADIYANALCLPFKDNVFDVVIATQVLEHINEVEAFIKEIFRVLKEGGYLILTVPFIWGLHDEPNDYFLFTKYGLSHLLIKVGFKIVFLEERGNFWEVVAQCISLRLYGYPTSTISDIFKRVISATIQISISPLSIIFGNKFRGWCLGYGVLAIKPKH